MQQDEPRIELIGSVEQLQFLSLFLATTNKITLQLKEALEAVSFVFGSVSARNGERFSWRKSSHDQ